MTLARRATAEAVGTALLLTAIVGSGIMADRLAVGNVAVALLANTLATGGVLMAMILALRPISGAHLNPAVTLADAATGGFPWREVPAYVLSQLAGAVAGVTAANTMFGEPAIFLSQRARHGAPVLISEFVATFGLFVVIWACARHAPHATAFAVAGYIVGAYWFTASTAFANPAVAIARCLTNTFAGIAPRDVPAFVGAELFGAVAATGLLRWLLRERVDPGNALMPLEEPLT